MRNPQKITSSIREGEEESEREGEKRKERETGRERGEIEQNLITYSSTGIR